MRVDKDVAIEASDGVVLRANVHRPDGPGRHPVLLAQGVYGKDVHFRDGFAPQWKRLLALHPGLCEDGSSGHYLRWETVDPERWVPHGYVVIQVDARGTGKSPGFVDPFCAREIRDLYESIEWAAVQPWSSGKVGLIGVSYYAIVQWLVAALRPPHLAAIVPWEGASDHYRDWSHHGGVPSNGFVEAWWPRQVTSVQHGSAASAYRDPDTGEPITGAPLPEEQLRGNRAPYPETIAAHPLLDAWHRERSPDLDRVSVPLLSAGNWGGPGVHLRGNIEGWMRAASADKWLSMHTGTHFESFYLPEYVAMQRRFLDHFLKGEDNGWDREPRVQLSVRRPDGSTRRMEDGFPLARTQWTRLHLDAATRSLGAAAPAAAAEARYDAAGGGILFTTAPFERDTEFTGFVSLHLWMASDTTDLDLFATLHAFDAAGREIVFDGAHEPTPVTRGWLRASHRAPDPTLSRPWRVAHRHDLPQPLVPGEPVELDVEIWPTSMVFPRGSTLALRLAGRDFEFPGIPGRILHNHPAGRDPATYGGTHTMHTGGERGAWLTMPLIPPSD